MEFFARIAGIGLYLDTGSRHNPRIVNGVRLTGGIERTDATLHSCPCCGLEDWSMESPEVCLSCTLEQARRDDERAAQWTAPCSCERCYWSAQTDS